MKELLEAIKKYVPSCEQEQKDKELCLLFAERNPDCLCRKNETAHFTASAWIVNRERTKVLFIYHKIYDSWSWVGGHADGESDLLAAALREAREETGLRFCTPVSEDIFSLELLTVEAHIRKGAYVAPHLHMNVTYLIEADENEALKLNKEETKDVRWFSFADALSASTEPKMKERVYQKLINKTVQK